LSLGGRSRSGAQVTSWISSENHRSHSSLQAHRANPLDHAQDGQGAGSPRQHCGANLAGARTQTSPAKELQTVTGPEVRRKASGKDRKVSSAAGGNLSRMHKTQETAKESRLNFMYSHLRNRTLVSMPIATRSTHSCQERIAQQFTFTWTKVGTLQTACVQPI